MTSLPAVPWKGYLPTTALNDQQIRPSRGRWRDVASRCNRTVTDLAAMERYRAEILNGGLRNPIRIGVDGHNCMFVGDGHRRAIALLQAGAIQFPAHWYRITPGGQPRMEDGPFPARLLDQ